MSYGRKYWTPREREAVFVEQGSKCARCPNETGPFIDEHEIPNWFLPGKPSAILCKACAKAKTRLDMRDIAKCKRRTGETPSQFARNKPKRKAWPKRDFPHAKRTRSKEEILDGR